jgi:hypothetical protein
VNENVARRATELTMASVKANYTLELDPGSFKLTGHPIELRVLRDLKLDPGGPFYQFVLTYLVASAGLTPVYDDRKYPNFMSNTARVFPGITADDARIDLAECVRLARGGKLPQQQAEQSLCCMLANTVFESIGKATRDRLAGNPVFEVFKHVRNAASHNNAWHFYGTEPKFRGQWKGLVIDETLRGDANPLQGKPCFYGMLQPADLLYLLQAVEGLL